MIDYSDPKIHAMVGDAAHAFITGNLVGIDYKICRIIGLHDPVPFSKREDCATELLTEVFGVAGLHTNVVVTPTIEGSFICEVDNGPGALLMVAEGTTPALAILSALVFSMAESLEIAA